MTTDPTVMPEIRIGGRLVGPAHPPLVIAEIGINHEGDEGKAATMVDAAAAAGCECVKLQTHVVSDEMIENDVVPTNADESIWAIMSRCALDALAESRLKKRAEDHGMIFLSTPFSRAAADRLQALGVEAFKIGSGECNNFPLIDHIAGFGKPVILSTGMNDMTSISEAVEILRRHRTPFALMHCTSIYPTAYHQVRLGALPQMMAAFPDAVVGLSDHSPGIYPCLGAVALGASILERHFTADKSWPGPDIPISCNPAELAELIVGSRAIFEARGGEKTVLPDEAPTAAFAFATVVAIADIRAGDELTRDNIWVKRPGTGEIPAAEFEGLLGCRAQADIRKDTQLRRDQISCPGKPSGKSSS